jgi:hypothetical protein
LELPPGFRLGVISAGLSVASVALFAWAVWEFLRGLKLRREAAHRDACFARTMGTVVGHQARFGSDGWGDYPVVAFYGPSGDEVHFESAFGSRPRVFSEGDHVNVLYDPANPADAHIDSALIEASGEFIFLFRAFGVAMMGGICFVFAFVIALAAYHGVPL